MIKKISAVVLALVLCLSVVVVPASALDLADGKDMAFELKWDKEYYNPGDTATLSVYMKVTDDMQLGTGSFVIGLNSAQITQTDNPVEDLKANAVASDLWNSFWKDPSQLTISWLASTIADKVEVANTEAEKGLYDQYMKIVINRNTADGSHENATTLKYGLPGSDINAIEEPIITFSYVVSASAERGTSLVAGITSGSTSCSPAQTAFKYIKAPGASTTANVAASAFDCSAAAAEATVGTPIISALNPQIRFNGLEKNGKGSANFDVRTRATVSKADLAKVLGVSEAELEATAKVSADLRVGFVYLAKSVGTFDADAAKNAAMAGNGKQGDYYVKDVTYIQRSGSNYMWTCLLTYIDGMYDDGVVVAPYIICGDTVEFLTGAEGLDVTFSTLYGTYYSQYAATQA